MARGNDPFCDGGDLRGCLSLAEHYFRETLPDTPVMIDTGEPKVFERGVAQELKDARLGSLRCKAAGLDLVEDLTELRPGHRCNLLVRVDFGSSSTLT
jgi:hypothetical protein